MSTDVSSAAGVHSELVGAAMSSIVKGQPRTLAVQLVASSTTRSNGVRPISHGLDSVRLVVVDSESHISYYLIYELRLHTGRGCESDHELYSLTALDDRDMVDLGREFDGVDASMSTIGRIYNQPLFFWSDRYPRRCRLVIN